LEEQVLKEGLSDTALYHFVDLRLTVAMCLQAYFWDRFPSMLGALVAIPISGIRKQNAAFLVAKKTWTSTGKELALPFGLVP